MPSLVNEFGNVLPEIPVSSAKHHHPTSKFKSGSYLDDDSLEVGKVIKKIESKSEKKPTVAKVTKPKASKGPVKEGKMKTRTLSAIEKMYHSLKGAGYDTRDLNETYFDNPQVSINVGRRGNPQESTEETLQEPTVQTTFDIATGNINHGNRSINYTVQEILGTCFAINLVVSVTQQSWMVFVPSSETVLELLRIWRIKNNPENMNKLCTWLLSCITLEFDDMTIVAAHFNHSLFQKCYTQEMIVCVQMASIKVQSHIRRYLSNKRLRFSLLKAKQVQESRILASMRVKALRKKNEQKEKPRTLKTLEPTSTISSNTDALANITQAFITNEKASATTGSKKKKRKGSPKRGGRRADDPAQSAAAANAAGTPRSPPGSARANAASANARRRLKGGARGGGPESGDGDDLHRTSMIEKEVINLKSNIGGTLNEFQSELQILKSELANQKQAQMYSRPTSSQYPIGSPITSRAGSAMGKAKSFSGGNYHEMVDQFQDVDLMKKEINSLLHKIGALEEDLNVQRATNERTQEIAKLEIMSAKLEAESAVERAAAKVRSDTINEIATQMRDIEKDRLRMEEEKAQRDLIREETMRRELEKKQQQMSEVLKQELFRQQLLQQQEQAALLQRQHELQEKLLQQQQQAKSSSPTNKKSPTAASAGVAAAAGGGFSQNEHVNLGQGTMGIAVNTGEDSFSYPKQSMNSYAESVNLGGSSASLDGGKTNKKTWNWLLFGGSSRGSSKGQVPPPQQQVQQQQQPFVAMTFEAPQVGSTPPTATPAAPSVATDSDRLVPSNGPSTPPAQPKKSKRQVKEERRYHAAVTIQHAALRFLRRTRFSRNENFVKLRAENMLTTIDHAKEEKVLNEAMAISMQLSHDALANKTLNRLYTLVVKYDKNEVLYPANYETVVQFLMAFSEDVPLLKKGFDVLNIVLKINSDIFQTENPQLTELLMKSVAAHETDPLMCFKVTRCIYRLCEKNASFRTSYGAVPQNLMIMRKLFEVYLKNPSIIENIMKCIINLCIDCVPNQDLFNQIGICDCVFFAFMEHLKVERLFYLICRAMVNLCANNHYTNQTQLAKGIYPNIFIKAIMLYKSNPRAIEQVITCVLSIVANHKINKGKFQDAGLCEVLLDLVRISEAYPSILTNCFWALSNLSNSSNPARKAVHQKIIDTIRKYEMESPDPELVRHAKIALNRIARSGSGNASRVATPIASVNVVGGNSGMPSGGTPQYVNSAEDDLNGASSKQFGMPSGRSNRLDAGGFTESVISDLSV